MNAAFVQGIHQCLEAALSPDTNTIKAATAELNTKYYKTAECIPALYEVIASSPNEGVRQFAATELRKRVYSKDHKLWIGVPHEYRERIKAGLLDRLLNEEKKIIRHQIARAIASIADHDLYAPSAAPSSSTTNAPSEWSELMPFITSTTQSSTASHREAALFVLFTILDTVRESYVNDMMTGMFQLFGTSLNDQDAGVRLITLRALGKVAEYIEIDQKDFIKQYQALMPQMLQVLQQILVADEVEGAKQAFDVFETCLILETPLISKSLKDYIEVCLAIAGKTDADEDIRNAALNSLSWSIQYKKGKVQSLGLAGLIIERLLPIGCEEDHEDDDDDSPSKLAFRTLDELAKALPPTQVFPVLSSQLQTYMASENPAMRKSALMAFGVTVEGCSEFIRPHVAQLWPLVDSGLYDADPVVRKAGCIALACMCEWLADECAERHAYLVPALFSLVEDAATQKSATACLEAYLEILGDNIAQYLTLLMEKFVGLLDTASIAVKTTVTGAIGSAAFASKEGFQPYFPETIRRIVPFLLLEGDGEEASLRSIAIDTLGTFAEVVGRDVFRPHFAELMQYAINGLQADSSRMKESALLFFGTMATVFEEEFAVYLPQTIPALIETCKQNEHDQFADSEGKTEDSVVKQALAAFATGAGSGTVSLDNAEDEDDDDFEDLDDDEFNVNTEVAIEKEIAGDVLGQIFEATREAFLPFLDQTVECLSRLLLHYYEGVRKSGITALFTIIKTYYEMSEPVDWSQSETVVPFHAQVTQLVDHIMPQIMDMWETEDDQQVNISICSSLAETITSCGPALVEGRQGAILTHCKAILEQTHECQQNGGFEEPAELSGETSEYEAVVISNAVEVISAMATAYGPAFAEQFGAFYPLITKFYGPERTTNEKSMVVGTLGEIIVGLRGGITPYTQQILGLLSKALQDPEAETRSNAAFAAGALIEWSDLDLSAQYGPLMQVLSGYFQVNDETPKDALNAKDNAAGCVARMIVKSPTALPLDAVLPIFFGGLPLKSDTIENKPTFRAIFYLFEHQYQLVAPHIDHLLSVFAYVSDESRSNEIPVETKVKLDQLVGALRSQIPAEKFARVGL